jgi:hypothetical protein
VSAKRTSTYVATDAVLVVYLGYGEFDGAPEVGRKNAERPRERDRNSDSDGPGVLCVDGVYGKTPRQTHGHRRQTSRKRLAPRAAAPFALPGPVVRELASTFLTSASAANLTAPARG